MNKLGILEVGYTRVAFFEIDELHLASLIRFFLRGVRYSVPSALLNL
jgi:hypothetical protein